MLHWLSPGPAGARSSQGRPSFPTSNQPEQFVPGERLFYATTAVEGGLGTGLLESHLGRPTKIEGNPTHPASLGGTDPGLQASILTLYDPDRSQSVLNNGRTNTWGSAIGALVQARNQVQDRDGDGLRILTRTISSPTLGAQIEEFLTRFPMARWHQWDPRGSRG